KIPMIWCGNPRRLYITPYGMRRSRPMRGSLPEDEIEQQCRGEYPRAEHRRARIPRPIRLAQSGSEGVDESGQVILRTRPRDQAHREGHEEAHGERPDCGPEVLRHLARIGMQQCEMAQNF